MFSLGNFGKFELFISQGGKSIFLLISFFFFLKEQLHHLWNLRGWLFWDSSAWKKPTLFYLKEGNDPSIISERTGWVKVPLHLESVGSSVVWRGKGLQSTSLSTGKISPRALFRSLKLYVYETWSYVPNNPGHTVEGWSLSFWLRDTRLSFIHSFLCSTNYGHLPCFWPHVSIPWFLGIESWSHGGDKLGSSSTSSLSEEIDRKFPIWCDKRWTWDPLEH